MIRRAIVCFLLGGCGPVVVSPSGETETGGTPVPTTTASDPGSTASPTASTSEPTTSGPETTDPADTTASLSSTDPSSSEAGTSTTAPAGCGAVDVLVVIDGSMWLIGQQVRGAGEEFADALLTAFPDESLHIGVISSSEYEYSDPDCRELGDLVTVTEAGDCMLESEYRFATKEDDLQWTMRCLMDLGNGSGGMQRPVTGSIAALSDAKAVPGACNEGFLREGALLGIFIVSADSPYHYEVDDASPLTDTSTWYESILAAKGGDASAVAVVGFISMEPLDCFEQGGQENPNLIGFIDEFGDHGMRKTICQGSISAFAAGFEEGVELLAQTCADWQG